MPRRESIPTGLARRRPRLSDEETERRMLEAAASMVSESGLTVSLDHLSFEDVIRDAHVSRSTVYRRWPYKDLFFSDLLKELARAATPAAVSSADLAVPRIARLVLDNIDLLRTPEGRQDLLLELMRVGSEPEFETMLGSSEWRTYLALHATFLSVADEKLRDELRSFLAAAEADFTRRIAASWRLLGDLLGYRLRPEVDATFETFASLASANLRGQVIMALASPDVATRRIRARPFGASRSADWSPSAISIASLASAFFEPDPGVAWDDARIMTVRDAFAALEARAGVTA